MPDVRAPEVCWKCKGYGAVGVYDGGPAGLIRIICNQCSCVICGQTKPDVNDGVCGECFDEAERHFERVSDR